ncbi:MAG: hypothetical protein ACREKM_02630 [Longimicrobiales bacterium]
MDGRSIGPRPFDARIAAYGPYFAMSSGHANRVMPDRERRNA